MDCLRCIFIELEPGKGALGEAVCPRCHGRLLDDGQAQTVLHTHCGLERSLVAEMAHHFKGRGSCPACTRTMALLPVRGVEVDLCIGCGSLFLDRGELKGLTAGAIDELPRHPGNDDGTDIDIFADGDGDGGASPPSPDGSGGISAPATTAAGGFSDHDRGFLEEAFGTPSSALPVVVDPAGTSPTLSGQCAVFLSAPVEAPDMELLVRAWGTAGFHTGMDARGFRNRFAGGIAVDDCPAWQADQIASILRDGGVPAFPVAVESFLPPPALRTKEVVVDGDTILVADSHGNRTPYPVGEILAVVGARTRVVSTTPSKGPTGPGGPAMAAAGTAGMLLPGGHVMRRAIHNAGRASAGPSSELRESEDVIVDIVLTGRRFRIDASGFIKRADGPRSLGELLQRLGAITPASCLWQSGARAIGNGSRPRLLKNPRELDREVAWALWRRQQG